MLSQPNHYVFGALLNEGMYLQVQRDAEEDVEVLIDQHSLDYAGESQSHCQSQSNPCKPASQCFPYTFHADCKRQNSVVYS